MQAISGLYIYYNCYIFVIVVYERAYTICNIDRNYLFPSVKPVMLAVLVMALVYNWNDFFSPLIYLNDNVKFTIAIGLQFFKGSQGNVQMGQMMAMSLVALLPVLVIFATCQKYFIQGIKMSGLKG